MSTDTLPTTTHYDLVTGARVPLRAILRQLGCSDAHVYVAIDEGDFGAEDLVTVLPSEECPDGRHPTRGHLLTSSGSAHSDAWARWELLTEWQGDRCRLSLLHTFHSATYDRQRLPQGRSAR